LHFGVRGVDLHFERDDLRFRIFQAGGCKRVRFDDNRALVLKRFLCLLQALNFVLVPQYDHLHVF
jgi:hypothetical protein